MEGALQGVKVIDLGHWAAGPSACVILADWGAEVIKVEDPRGGDAFRGVTYPNIPRPPDINIWFEQYNRNKKSVAVDLGHPRGREIVHRLVRDTDVLVTNFLPPVLKRYSVDYQSLRELNPRLIYAGVTGYGERGRDSDKPGYDFNAFWARGGFMDLIAAPGAAPIPQRSGMGDNTIAMLVAGAICAALLFREKTGQGQELAFSLFHTATWVLSMDIGLALHAGVEIPKADRLKATNPLRNSYRTKDGQWIWMMMLQSDRFWGRFCKAIGREDLEHDPRFSSHQKRAENNEALISIIDEVVAGRGWAEWDRVFTEQGLIYERVHSVSDVVADPQARENGFFTEVAHPVSGRVKLVASPVKFGVTPASVRCAAPELGEHTEEVLLGMGYTWQDIAGLKESKVIL